MNAAQLKEQIERGEYQVDPVAVADAMLRRLRGLTQNECSYPESSPSASTKATPGVPSTTKPTHVSSAPRLRGPRALFELLRASGPARRRTARNPRRRSRRTTAGRRRARAAISATPSASGSEDSDSSIRTPLRRARWPASVARPSDRSIIARAPSSDSARPASRRGPGRAYRSRSASGYAGVEARAGAAVEHGEARTGAPERACDCHPVARSRAVARDQLPRVPGPADDRERHRQRGRASDVAAGDRHPDLRRQVAGTTDNAPGHDPSRTRLAARAQDRPRRGGRPSPQGRMPPRPSPGGRSPRRSAGRCGSGLHRPSRRPRSRRTGRPARPRRRRRASAPRAVRRPPARARAPRSARAHAWRPTTASERQRCR